MAGPARPRTVGLLVACRVVLVSAVPVGALGLSLGQLARRPVTGVATTMLIGVVQAVVSLAGGQLADRWRRTPTIVLAAGGTAVAWAVAAVWGAQPAVGIGAAAAVGAGAGLFLPATSGLMQELVADRRLVRLNAVLLLATVAANFAVPVLAAWLVGVPFGWSGLVGAATVLTAGAAVLAVLVHRRLPAAERTGEVAARPAAGEHPAVGERSLAGERRSRRWWMRPLVLAFGVLGALAAAPEAVTNLPAGFGVDAGFDLPRQLATAAAVIAAAVLLICLPVRRPARLALLVCLAAVPALLAVAGAVPWWLSAAALVLASTAGTVFGTLAETVLELHVPADVISRSAALVWFVQGLVPLLALALAASGYRWLLAVLGAALVGVAGAALAVPGIRRLPGHRPQPDPAADRQSV